MLSQMYILSKQEGMTNSYKRKGLINKSYILNGEEFGGNMFDIYTHRIHMLYVIVCKQSCH